MIICKSYKHKDGWEPCAIYVIHLQRNGNWSIQLSVSKNHYSWKTYTAIFVYKIAANCFNMPQTLYTYVRNKRKKNTNNKAFPSMELAAVRFYMHSIFRWSETYGGNKKRFRLFMHWMILILGRAFWLQNLF